jgi:hypothetical protein
MHGPVKHGENDLDERRWQVGDIGEGTIHKSR